MERSTLRCARCGQKIRPSDPVVYLGTGDFHPTCVVQVVKERS